MPSAPRPYLSVVLLLAAGAIHAQAPIAIQPQSRPSVVATAPTSMAGTGGGVQPQAPQGAAVRPTSAAGDAYWNNTARPAAGALRSAQPTPGDAYWSNRSGQIPGGDLDVPSLPTGASSVSEVMASALLKSEARSSVEPLRAQQIQDAAAAYGVQSGMDAQANAINQAIDARAAGYDRVFDFSALMLEPGFLPPVISEGRDAYNQPTPDEVRAASRLYRIEFPARLVSVAPTWRDYLPVPITGVSRPDPSVLPKGKDEESIWNEWAVKGWNRGTALAEETFEANLARLSRDFNGMLRYKALYEQGVVSKPLLAQSSLGVTGGGNEMALDDRIYRITDRAQLDPNAKRWRRAVPITAPSDMANTAAPGQKDAH